MKCILSAILACLVLSTNAWAQTTCTNYANIPPASEAYYYPARGEFFIPDSDNSLYIKEVNFGPAKANLIGLAGDWNGNGFAGIGYYDPNTANFYLKYQATSGPADLSFLYGWVNPGVVQPIVGDWTKKGYKSIGIYDGNASQFFLKNTNASGNADIILPFTVVSSNTGKALVNPIAIAGDWVGDGITRVGLYDPVYSYFYFRMTNDPNNNTYQSLGLGGSLGFSPGQPFTGKWTSSMTTDGVGLKQNLVKFVEIYERNGIGIGNANEIKLVEPSGSSNGVDPQVLASHFKPSQCLSAGQNTTPTNSPAWLKNTIFYDLRFETFNVTSSGFGTFNSAAQKLAYLASLGVTGIVTTPISSLNSNFPNPIPQSFYGVALPDVLDPRLGTDADFTNFVAQAHSLGIKVIVDLAPDGINPGSPYMPSCTAGANCTKPFTPMPQALPADFFTHNTSGQIQERSGNGDLGAYDWTSPALWNWWSTNVAVAWVKKYNIDGYRLDTEPFVAGTPFWNKIRADVNAATGKQIVMMSEHYKTLETGVPVPSRGYTFDLSQHSAIGLNGELNDIYDGPANIVDVVKSLNENYYTYFVSDHDNSNYTVNGRLSALGYGGILGPFIPHWFAGEEFNANVHPFPNCSYCTSLYTSSINWNDLTTNNAFEQQVQQLIKIRKQYQNIIAPMNGPMNQTNIAKVTNYTGTDLMPYSMWNGTTSITVVAKRNTAAGNVTLSVPVGNMGMGSYNYFNVTNLITNAVSLSSASSVNNGLTVNVAQGGVVPLKVSAVPLNSIVIGNIDGFHSNGDGSYNVNGWACSIGVDIPITVQMYINGSVYTQALANQSSEPAVSSPAVCNNAGSAYRFTLKLGTDAIVNYGGQPFTVYGISPIGGSNRSFNNPYNYVIPVITPSTPANLTATAGDNQVSLSWNPSTETPTYTVKRSTVSGGPYTTMASALTAAAYTDKSAVDGTVYYYVVSATNAAGTSTNSNQASAKPEPAPPSAPTGLSVSLPFATISLSWNASTSTAGVAGYKIYRNGVLDATTTVTSYADIDLNGNTSYTYTVSAFDAYGNNSAQSGAIVVVTGYAGAGGYFDAINGHLAQGWAYYPETSSSSINVSVSIDGVIVNNAVPANVYRADVDNVMKVAGNHGFSWTIPANYYDGKTHVMHIFAVDPTNGSTAELNNSPRSFTLTS